MSVAFITGGARGLGNAVAVAFAKEGTRGVVLVDVQDEDTFETGRRAVEKHGAKCITVHADVTKEDEVARAVDLARETFGRIDYAVNFAGIFQPAGPIHDAKLEEFNQVMAVNCTGVLIAMKYELKQMMTQDIPADDSVCVRQRGSIVNAASLCSFQGITGTAAYTASKHAVAGLTKIAALEAKPYNIRVNAIAPGFLRTGMNDQGNLGAADENGGDVSAVWKVFETRQGRMAHHDEIGQAVVSMSLPRMSLVNGTILNVDNGFVINAESDTSYL